MTRKRKLLNAVIIIALILGSLYVYLLSDGGISTPINAQSAPEPLATEDAIHFAVIGDFGGVGEPTAAVARMVKSWQPDWMSEQAQPYFDYFPISSSSANTGSR